MRKEEVEIYSDQSNYAIMRHPGRSFPGALIQGDSLEILCTLADSVRQELDRGDLEEAKAELEALRESLWDRLQHYAAVMTEHELQLPFNSDATPQPPLEEYEEEQDGT